MTRSNLVIDVRYPNLFKLLMRLLLILLNSFGKHSPEKRDFARIETRPRVRAVPGLQMFPYAGIRNCLPGY
jgi:hypothetical protein